MIGVILGIVINTVGYSLGRAFIYSTPEYAVMKLPYQILEDVVGSVLGYVLSFACGIKKLFEREFGSRKIKKTTKINNCQTVFRKLIDIFFTKV